MILDCAPPAESKTLYSSSSLSLAKWVKTMRRHILNIYIDSYAYANLFLAKQTLVKVKDRVFLVEPAYYLKPLYRVRGWVCDVSFFARNMYNKMVFIALPAKFH